MRLIDADALADALFDKRKNYPQWVADTIGNMPDVVVRCKDCKQGEQSVLPNRHLWCRIHEFYREPEWFCADGERRTK